MKPFPLSVCAAFVLLGSSSFHLQAAEPKCLLGSGSEPPELKPNSPEVTSVQSGDSVSVEFAPGGIGPALYIRPPDGVPWDLAEFGHLEAMITNTGEEAVVFSLRVDNKGDHTQQPWNTESAKIEPGQTAPIKVIFGHQFGYHPGYRLDPSRVSALLIFTAKSERPIRFRIVSIRTGGQPGEKPPVDPQTVRIDPPDGYILGGAGTKLDAATQVQASIGVSAEVADGGGEQVADVRIESGTGNRHLSLVPPMGAWNLNRSTQLEVQISNTGTNRISPSLQLANMGADERSDVVTFDKPLDPNATATLVLPYAPKKTWVGPSGDLAVAANRKGQPETGTRFASDKVAKIIFRFPDEDGEGSLRINSIRAVVVTQKTPDWLGQRPPVEGDWKVTLNDDFDGDAINEKIWDVTGPNYWGQKKLTHWSRQNVMVKDGVATIRLEKKAGPHNDDAASGHASEYAGGILRSYDKWAQLYGYFETRVKLPEVTAMWPAFWLMPERGPAAGDQYKRQSTSGRGMEFDILEHLTRWGPYRYTVAMHWDDYGKMHKATGSAVYFNPDPEGYVTAGLLWLPGQAVFYCNGKEVARWENERVSAEPSSILYTMPIGGWDNANHPVDAELPADFVIDYVRVWQRADLLDVKLPPDATK